jgi:hypothetical protein
MIKQNMPWVIYLIAVACILFSVTSFFFHSSAMSFLAKLYGTTVSFFLLRSFWIELGEDNEA